ncbi:Mitochondrial succinate-fumarate transporter [Blastocladiella emersonii ATCC 22665]|nr:Mitochondrial succinate-fumarate transporter [Blastocladiella emersonii ATCC 22665]
MSAAAAKKPAEKKKTLSTHLIAGGSAGFMEAMVCHPLDTIKVRLQLQSARAAGEKRVGFIGTGVRIAQREGFLALYKGLGAVVTGIVPKMAIRFSSFNFYKTALADKTTGVTSTGGTFLAGLGAGITEAVLVVTPMEVVKIRLQAQRHSLSDPLDVPKYRNPAHAAYTIVKEEGFSTLWRGVSLTALRQATNQAANFTTYQELKKRVEAHQGTELQSWQHLTLGLISGAMGPLCNNPIDTIKTRVQRSPTKPGQTAMQHMREVVVHMWAKEGVSAFYKGLTPRLLRVAPGNAVTFTVYEFVAKRLDLISVSLKQTEEQLKQKDAEY